jgi:hypothetical protein
VARWNTFQISKTVVHYVETLRDAADPQLLLTSEAIDLDSDLTDYFQSKIADRLETKALAVVRDLEQSPIVPDALLAALTNPQSLLAQSQVIAKKLYDVQGKVNSSGLLAIILGTVGANAVPCVAVVKLERQRGVSFEIDRQTGMVDLELLRNLTLTDKTKVYKTAVFAASKKGLEGYVADDQRTSAKGNQVAGFFLGEFLGCQPKEPAAITTYRFVKAANTAINSLVKSPETRGRYQVGLLALMQDNSTDIRPASFATKHLDKDDRGPFLEAIEKAGIDPKVSFTKDTTRVSIREFKMTFDSGMVLVGPSAALKDNVEIPESPGAEDPVKLRDSVTSILAGR